VKAQFKIHFPKETTELDNQVKARIIRVNGSTEFAGTVTIEFFHDPERMDWQVRWDSASLQTAEALAPFETDAIREAVFIERDRYLRESGLLSQLQKKLPAEIQTQYTENVDRKHTYYLDCRMTYLGMPVHVDVEAVLNRAGNPVYRIIVMSGQYKILNASNMKNAVRRIQKVLNVQKEAIRGVESVLQQFIKDFQLTQDQLARSTYDPQTHTLTVLGQAAGLSLSAQRRSDGHYLLKTDGVAYCPEEAAEIWKRVIPRVLP
jgi:hypothetical protein